MGAVAIQIKRRLTSLLFSDPLGPELYMGLVSAIWAVLFLTPHQTFGTSPSYSVMAILAPEWVWGCGMAVLAVACLFGTFSEHYRLRRFSAMAGVTAWGLIGWLLLLANPGATGAYVYLLLGMQCGVTYWRLEALHERR